MYRQDRLFLTLCSPYLLGQGPQQCLSLQHCSHICGGCSFFFPFRPTLVAFVSLYSTIDCTNRNHRRVGEMEEKEQTSSCSLAHLQYSLYMTDTRNAFLSWNCRGNCYSMYDSSRSTSTYCWRKYSRKKFSRRKYLLMWVLIHDYVHVEFCTGGF